MTFKGPCAPFLLRGRVNSPGCRAAKGCFLGIPKPDWGGFSVGVGAVCGQWAVLRPRRPKNLQKFFVAQAIEENGVLLF